LLVRHCKKTTEKAKPEKPKKYFPPYTIAFTKAMKVHFAWEDAKLAK